MYERISKRRNEGRFFPNSVYPDDIPSLIPPSSSLPLLQSRYAVFNGSPREGEVGKIYLVNWQRRNKGEGVRGVRRGEGEKGREHEGSGG